MLFLHLIMNVLKASSLLVLCSIRTQMFSDLNQLSYISLTYMLAVMT